MRQLLIRINQQENCTILLSSHILSEIEKLCSDVAIISAGTLAFQGKMQALLHDSTGRETITIHSADADKAKGLISGRFEARIRERNLVVTVNGKSEAALIIRMLIENRIDIYSAERESTGLEASFLHLQNENNKV